MVEVFNNKRNIVKILVDLIAIALLQQSAQCILPSTQVFPPSLKLKPLLQL